MPRNRNAEAAASANNADDPTMDAEINETGAVVDPDAAYMADAPADDTSGFFLDLSKADERAANMAVGTVVVCAVSKAEAKISNNGNPMIGLVWKVERVNSTPPSVTEDTARTYVKRTMRDNVMFTPPNEITGSRGALWRAKLVFDALGVPWAARQFKSKTDFMNWLTDSAEQMIGALAVITVGEETSSGIDPATNQPYPPRNTVARIAPYESAPIRNDSDDDIPF